MPAADLTKWPHNSASNLVDEHPNWREVYDFDNWPVHKIRQVSVDSLKILMRLDLWARLPPETKDAVTKIVNGMPLAESNLTVLTPEKLTSLADSANRAEIARAAIDPLQLMQIAVDAIKTGDLSGAQLMPRDRIDLLKWLGNKVLADARSIDHREVAQQVDRTRRRKFSADDLKNLSKQELLDIMASEEHE